MRQFATMNYHSCKSKEDGEAIVIQITRDVQRAGGSKDATYTFPLKKHHDAAFNAPEGWLDSHLREQSATCIMLLMICYVRRRTTMLPIRTLCRCSHHPRSRTRDGLGLSQPC
jgi:hypothetical protein